MSQGPDGRAGGREGATPPAPGAEGPAGDAEAAGEGTEIVSFSTVTEALDLLQRERSSALFKPPTKAPAPGGMATDEQVESFRELRTRLMLLAEGAGLTHFTTMVAPMTEGSGASFVARNLAASFTLQQRLAVLVDCNFRSPTEHEVFGLDPGAVGLLQFLRRATEVPVERLIHPTSLPGLHVVPAGRGKPARTAAPREHLSSLPMKALLARLRHEPCFVVLDGPPVEGSPDARILSDLADFVVLVVGYGRTTPRAIARAAALFERRKLAGIVFNELAAPGETARARPRGR